MSTISVRCTGARAGDQPGCSRKSLGRSIRLIAALRAAFTTKGTKATARTLRKATNLFLPFVSFVLNAARSAASRGTLRPHRSTRAVLLGLPFAVGPLDAQGEPVLRQIKVPHGYYYREMYLPQLTSGPSALTWSPDGQELIYSMHGSLWRSEQEKSNALEKIRRARKEFELRLSH
jgi:hypothetical protein